MCFNKFSTEELRFATGSSAPVARNKKVFDRFDIGFYNRFPTEELRLVTGTSTPVARKQICFNRFYDCFLYVFDRGT